VHAYPENVKMQNINLVLLLKEYAVKIDSLGLIFLGFFEKCAAIIFYTSHSQIRHVSSKHKFVKIVKLQISVRKKCVQTKKTRKLGWQP
jgi:hypothetical protein